MMMDWHALGIDTRGKSHGNIKTWCPACQRQRDRDAQPSLSVDLDRERWFCHKPSCDFRGANPERNGGAPGRPVAWEAPRPLPQVATPTLWEKAVEWFAGRGISEQALLDLKITVSREWCKVCEAEQSHIHFPVYVGGEHVNTKHRCVKKHFRQEKGARRALYNMDACEGHDTIVIVEGEMDVLALRTAGIPNVVSVPDGAPKADTKDYSRKFAFLEDAEGFITAKRHVILATDADAPGRTLMEELARRIGPEKCSRVVWDFGMKDANEVLVAVGPEALAQQVAEARPYPVEGIFTGHDLLDDLLDLYENGEAQGYDFGVPALDPLYSIHLGHLSVWTGIPSHGKSSVLDQLLIWLAERHGIGTAIFSPEQQPLRLHQRDLIRQKVGKSFLKDHEGAMTRDEVIAANAWVADHFSFILPEDASIEKILDLARIEVYRRGIRAVVIDPWNQLEHSRPAGVSQTEYIGTAITKFRQFARNHEVHMFLVAHPKKMDRDEDGGERVPGLWDISDSAHWRNMADVGVTVWRDLDLASQGTNRVELHVTKMRWDHVGSLGKATFGYHIPSKRLYELTR